MNSVVSAIRNTVPITQFNRGLAGQIFEDVKSTGAKVVMKNNVAECVLLSPDEYVQIMDELEDARLLVRTETEMLIVVIGARADEDAYKLAHKRRIRHDI